jgi:hypothetical protein
MVSLLNNTPSFRHRTAIIAISTAPNRTRHHIIVRKRLEMVQIHASMTRTVRAKVFIHTRKATLFVEKYKGFQLVFAQTLMNHVD